MQLETEVVVYGHSFFTSCILKKLLDEGVRVLHLVPKHSEKRYELPLVLDEDWNQGFKTAEHYRYNPSSRLVSLMYPGPMTWPHDSKVVGPHVRSRTWNFVSKQEDQQAERLRNLDSWLTQQKFSPRSMHGYQLLSRLVEPAWTREKPLFGLSLGGQFDIEVKPFVRGLEEYLSERLGDQGRIQNVEIHSLQAKTVKAISERGPLQAVAERAVVLCPDFLQRHAFEQIFMRDFRLDRKWLNANLRYRFIHEFTIHSRDEISADHVVFFENMALFATSPRELRCLFFQPELKPSEHEQVLGPPMTEVTKSLFSLLGWESCTLRGYRRVESLTEESISILNKKSSQAIKVAASSHSGIPSQCLVAMDWVKEFL